jgi:hypothetical protein
MKSNAQARKVEVEAAKPDETSFEEIVCAHAHVCVRVVGGGDNQLGCFIWAYIYTGGGFTLPVSKNDF